MNTVDRLLAWFKEAYGDSDPRGPEARRSGGMVFLGYGKYWRADGIIGLMPIEDERGPKRRTYVFVAGRAEPIVASRTEQSILDDMGGTAPGGTVNELLHALHDLSPALRRTLQENQFDVERWEQRLGESLRAPHHSAADHAQQSELFD